MKLSIALEAYQYNSGQTSANVRQLGFAALASIWVFKTANDGGVVALDVLLWWVGLLSIGALFFDFLQYVWNTVTWGQFHRKHELLNGPDAEVPAPDWINWVGNACFTIKVGCIVLSYILLLIFLVRHIATA